jgi:hypothetical protein
LHEPDTAKPSERNPESNLPLYQVGLGFTPIQAGLLMMPQAISAMSLKLAMPSILARDTGSC